MKKTSFAIALSAVVLALLLACVNSTNPYSGRVNSLVTPNGTPFTSDSVKTDTTYVTGWQITNPSFIDSINFKIIRGTDTTDTAISIVSSTVIPLIFNFRITGTGGDSVTFIVTTIYKDGNVQIAFNQTLFVIRGPDVLPPVIRWESTPPSSGSLSMAIFPYTISLNVSDDRSIKTVTINDVAVPVMTKFSDTAEIVQYTIDTTFFAGGSSAPLHIFASDSAGNIDSFTVSASWRKPTSNGPRFIPTLRIPIGDSLQLDTLPVTLAWNVIDTASRIDSFSVNGTAFSTAVWTDNVHRSAAVSKVIDSTFFGTNAMVPLVLYASDSLGHITEYSNRLFHRRVGVPTFAWISPTPSHDTLRPASLPTQLRIVFDETTSKLDTLSIFGAAFDSIAWSDSLHMQATAYKTIDATTFGTDSVVPVRIRAVNAFGGKLDTTFRLVKPAAPIVTSPHLSRIVPSTSTASTDSPSVNVSVLASNLVKTATYKVYFYSAGILKDSGSASGAIDTLGKVFSFSTPITASITPLRFVLMSASTGIDSISDTILHHAPKLHITSPAAGDSLHGGLKQTVAGYVTGIATGCTLVVKATDTVGVLGSDTVTVADSSVSISLTPNDSAAWVRISLYSKDTLLDNATIPTVKKIGTGDTAQVVKIVRTEPSTDSVTTTIDSLLLSGVIDGLRTGDSCIVTCRNGHGGTVLSTATVKAAATVWRYVAHPDTGISDIGIIAAFKGVNVDSTWVHVTYRKAVIDSGAPSIASVLSGGLALPATTINPSLPLDIIAADQHGDSIVAVTVNGTGATYSGSLTWHCPFTLTHKTGGDTIRVIAINSKGKSIEKDFYVVLNHGPVFTHLPNTATINTYDTFVDSVKVSDADADPVKLTVTAVYASITDTIHPTATGAFTWKPSVPQSSGAVSFHFSATDGYQTVDSIVSSNLEYLKPDSLVITTPLTAFPDTMRFYDTSLTMSLSIAGTVLPSSWTAEVTTASGTFDISAGSTIGDIFWQPDGTDTGMATIRVIVSASSPSGPVGDTLTKNIYIHPETVSFALTPIDTAKVAPTVGSITIAEILSGDTADAGNITIISDPASTAQTGTDFNILGGGAITMMNADTGTIRVRIYNQPPTGNATTRYLVLTVDPTTLPPGLRIGPNNRRIIAIAYK